MPPLRNILVFHAGALGDFVLSWPLVLALGRIHPQSRIICITHGEKAALAEKILRVDSADIESGWHHLYADATKLPARSAQLIQNAHSIYSFISAAGDAWTANVSKLAPQSQIVQLRFPPAPTYAGHATEYLLESLAAYPAVVYAMQQMVRSVNDRGLGAASKKKAKSILIHPGSGSRDKCWPAEKFCELAGRLVQAGKDVRFMIGEVEAERWKREELAAFGSVAEVIRPLNYIALAASLAEAAQYIGNDSGPSHLAGVLGLRTLCLFGATNPATWRPLGPHVKIVQRQPIESIAVDEIYDLAMARE
jgi:ADP-heptose:LPS heptosyltransferase